MKEKRGSMNILKEHNKYHFFNALTIEKELVAKNYLFNFDVFGNCFLEDTTEFKMPEKVYDIEKNLRFVIKKSFSHNSQNLGVLLTGNKGQGKSVTAKLICKDIDIPVIIINKPIPNDVNFISFLKNITQDYILFIDEFEKLFKSSNSHGNEKNDNHSQESFLSFMDGVLTTENKILFLLTTNEHVNEFLINRPSRIKFLKEYDELSEELFEMIVSDKLTNKEYREDLENSVSFLNLNIDLLINMVNDINMLDKPFSTFSNLYNYKFERYKYEIYISENGNIEKWSRIITLDNKPKAKEKYLCGYSVHNMIKFTKEEIVFESEDYDDKDNKVQIKIRMVPANRISGSVVSF